jgi:hypothetical protein
MTPKRFLTGLFLACAIGAASAAPAAGPAADFRIEQDYTEKSNDGAISIEQYVKITDDDAMWQFWIRRQDTMTLLNVESAEYPAGFRFTSDNQWLVRMQKTGSGESTLYLYKSGPNGLRLRPNNRSATSPGPSSSANPRGERSRSRSTTSRPTC